MDNTTKPEKNQICTWSCASPFVFNSC